MASGLERYLEHEELRDPAAAKAHQRASRRRLLSLMARHRKPLVLGFLMIGLWATATLAEPRIFGYAIDEAILPRRWGKLVQIGIAFACVVATRVAAAISQAYFFERLGQGVTQDLRVELFSHLMRLPAQAYDRHPAGRLLTRVTNDITSLNEMFSAGFVTIFSNSLMVLGIMAWLLVLDWRLGLVAISVFPLLAAVSVWFSRMLRGAYRESRGRLSGLNAFLAENLGGMKVIHLFGRERHHLERFDRLNEWYNDSQVATIQAYALLQPSITVATGAAMALVIVFGGDRVLDGTLKVGLLVAYFSYAISLFQPVREIADKWNVFLSGMTSAERIFAVLEWPTELETRQESEAAPLEGLRGDIVFEDVWFAYEAAEPGKERWVLKDFSLRIPAGTRVGVVGHTGAGKTTLISLLMRFYEPQRGRILLDGKDLREYDKRRLRASIGIIQQDAFVFSGALRDNVTFWRDPSSPGAEAAREALERLGFGRWWSDPGAEIRERGTNLSMGEKQVLAFARAIAARPQVWILDEATANMDSQTESRLQEALGEASRGRTSILIAHRLATVRSADLILVLHKGVLQEQGSHPELLAQDGLYARLYRFQQAQEDSGALTART